MAIDGCVDSNWFRFRLDKLATKKVKTSEGVNLIWNQSLQLMRNIAFLMFLCWLSPLHGNEVLDAAESAYHDSSKKCDEAFSRFKDLLSAEQRQKWVKVHDQWRTISEKEADLIASVTSGGGSAYSVDFLHELTERLSDRAQFYIEIERRFLAASGDEEKE